jgi:hypothetical protein
MSKDKMKHPNDQKEAREQLIAELQASNLSDDTKKKLIADIRADDPQGFVRDGGPDALETARDGA